MFIDSHAHLYFPNYEGELDEVMERAKNAGVDYVLVPATDLENAKQAINLTGDYPEIYAAVGVHPHETAEWKDDWKKWIRKFTNYEKVVAVGEIGLDYYYDFSPKDIQIKAFKSQIDLAIELDLPIIVHNRDSNEDMMNIIREYKDSGLKAHFHCFAGSAEDAKKLIQMGHYVSYPGNITFKKAEELRNTLKNIASDRLLIETDSPFMAPVPFRGKRNEPAYVRKIAEKVAEIKDLSVEDVARISSYNAFKLYGIGEQPKLSYTYKIRNSLYINVTNRCTSDCEFCKRKAEPVVRGYNLNMSKSQEPPAEKYIEEIGDPTQYDEIVFCGYGEPTVRWDVVKKVAEYVKSKYGRTRLNTNGHGNYVNKKDITPELQGLMDTVSISLNSTDKQEYAELMNVSPDLHDEMVDFAKKAKQYSRVVLSVVNYEGVDTEAAEKFADGLGVEFRLRNYFY